MPSPSPREFQLGRFSALIEATQIDVPGVSGWIGTWHIYRLPRSIGDMPLRYGDTDIVESPTMAIGMARSVVMLVARSL